ncbi:MAG: AMP-binding protein, partial [Gemmatimonadaceae bacterium]
MSTPHPNFSCILVGGESLLIACGDILLEHRHEIRAVVSGDATIRQWATANGLRVLDPATDYCNTLADKPFDYLLSITNLEILPPQLLSLATRGAINFHDGPLPRYGGLFAPVWALIDGQQSYGITWHAMTERADAGSIIEQQLFDIDPGETSLTLNTKCYAAGIETFPAVVNALAAGVTRGREHVLDQATFHRRRERPRGNCSLYWSAAAADLAALSRALDFGPYPNQFGLPRFTLAGRVILARHISVADATSGASPGTIVNISEKAIVVATAEGDAIVSLFSSIDGVPLTGAELAVKHGLSIGDHLEEPDADTTERLSQAAASIARNEPFWASRLASSTSAELPYGRPVSAVSGATACASMSIAAPMLEVMSNLPDISRADFVTAAFCAYLARLAGTCDVDVGFGDSALLTAASGNEPWLTTRVPLRINSEVSGPTSDALSAMLDELATVRAHGPFARDMMARYPALTGWREPSIAITQSAGAFIDDSMSAALTVVVTNDDEMAWRYREDALSASDIDSMQRQFATFLRALDASWKKPLADIAILDAAELVSLTREWNATEADVEKGCIHEAIETQAEKSPDRIAVTAGTSSLSYHALDNRSNQLARHLQQLGVGPDVLVGLCLDRSTDMMVAMLGVLKAGGAYVPLDPAYPSGRLAFMVQDAHAAVLITHQHLAALLPDVNAPVVMIDTEWDSIAREETGPVASDVTPANLAYVIYTSGST